MRTERFTLAFTNFVPQSSFNSPSLYENRRTSRSSVVIHVFLSSGGVAGRFQRFRTRNRCYHFRVDFGRRRYLCRDHALADGGEVDADRAQVMQIRIPTLLLITICYSGCLVLPIPHKRFHAPGVECRVVDSRSKRPVANATIQDTNRPSLMCHSDAGGHFTLEPVYGWHGAVLISAIGYSLFPSLDVPDFERNVSISAPHYGTRAFRFLKGDFDDFAHPDNVELNRR